MVVFMISLNFSKIFEKYCLDTLMFTFKYPYQTAPVYIKHDVQEKLTYVFHSLNSGIYLSLLLLTQAFNDCFKISVFSMFFFATYFDISDQVWTILNECTTTGLILQRMVFTSDS